MGEVEDLITRLKAGDKEAEDKLAEIGKPAVARMIRLSKHKEWSVQQGASDTLVKIGKPAVPALIKALENKNSRIRFWAAVSLRKIGDTEAVPALIEMLERKDSERGSAANALEAMKDERAVPALIKTLEDEDANVRQWASNALQSIGKPAISQLKALVKLDDPRLRNSAIFILGRIRAEEGIPILTASMDHESAVTRSCIAEALANIGNSTVEHIVYALKNTPSRKTALEALEKITNRCETTEELNEFERRIDKALEKLRCRREEEIEIGLKVAMIKKKIAARKNDLASKRDLILEDIPKPPKKERRRMYRIMRCRIRI